MSKTNKRVRAKLCADLYVDMQTLMPARQKYLVGPDGIHPSEEGYEELAIRLGKVAAGSSLTGVGWQQQQQLLLLYQLLLLLLLARHTRCEPQDLVSSHSQLAFPSPPAHIPNSPAAA